MSRKPDNDSKGETGDANVLEDFVPSPDQLASKQERVKVTLALSRRSVEYFKSEARQRGVSYQRMIRTLVDAYARHQEQR